MMGETDPAEGGVGSGDGLPGKRRFSGDHARSMNPGGISPENPLRK
jgi:hypothetical protein